MEDYKYQTTFQGKVDQMYAKRADKFERRQVRLDMWKTQKLVYVLTPHPGRPGAYVETFEPQHFCSNVKFEKLRIRDDSDEIVELPICREQTFETDGK